MDLVIPRVAQKPQKELCPLFRGCEEDNCTWDALRDPHVYIFLGEGTLHTEMMINDFYTYIFVQLSHALFVNIPRFHRFVVSFSGNKVTTGGEGASQLSDPLSNNWLLGGLVVSMFGKSIGRRQGEEGKSCRFIPVCISPTHLSCRSLLFCFDSLTFLYGVTVTPFLFVF